MKNTGKNIFKVIAAIVFVVSAFAAVLPGSSVPPKFKNLKVLPKDISEEALDSIMDDYCYALDVKCNFCHQKDPTTKKMDFASDANGTKNIARNMMRMTNDINKKYFNFSNAKVVPQTVTCITCHRRNPVPIVDSVGANK